VQLQPTKQLRKGVDLWPLIANPSTREQQHINASLTKLNQVLTAAVSDCDADYRDWARDEHQSLKGKNGDWERAVKVTMTGPRLLSIVATDDAACGGAHPNSDTMAMVFDLETGKPVNWMKQIAASAKAAPFSDSVVDGSNIGALIVPAIRDLSIAGADSDCKDIFDEKQSYQLWPDAKTGTLVAEPFDLPHAVAACAEDLALTLDQARKLGFNESILTAIETAHRQ
jgi:hypothetical protein